MNNDKIKNEMKKWCKKNERGLTHSTSSEFDTVSQIQCGRSKASIKIVSTQNKQNLADSLPVTAFKNAKLLKRPLPMLAVSLLVPMLLPMLLTSCANNLQSNTPQSNTSQADQNSDIRQSSKQPSQEYGKPRQQQNINNRTDKYHQPSIIQQPSSYQQDLKTQRPSIQSIQTQSQTTPNYNYPHGYRSFYDWKNDFTQRAINSGYRVADVQRLMNNASYNERVVSNDKNQSEFVKMPWEYVDSAVSASRVQTGQSKFAENQLLFNRLQSIYGVDAGVVAAIWGMESSFGGFMGSADLSSSLSTLAYEGRRRTFAEKQLKALLQLIQRGDVSWYQMEGSWAGGMGHTQFIPATWLQQGVDGNGDGHRNPWNTTDALSSTANYLGNSGWVRGLSPFYEVQLPNNFNFQLLNQSLDYHQWYNQGIREINGGYIPRGTALKLWLPAGQDGPALLTSKNFDVIKVYNNSSSYALGVSVLAKRIMGLSGLRKSWPRYERPLNKYQVENLQRNLTNAGYDTNGIDGVIGSNTRKAFARWQASHGQVADGFITQRSASSLMW